MKEKKVKGKWYCQVHFEKRYGYKPYLTTVIQQCDDCEYCGWLYTREANPKKRVMTRYWVPKEKKEQPMTKDKLRKGKKKPIDLKKFVKLAKQICETAIHYCNPPISWSKKNNDEWLTNRSVEIASQLLKEEREATLQMMEDIKEECFKRRQNGWFAFGKAYQRIENNLLAPKKEER